MPPDFDVHVCMVSDQAAPNLLPVLDAQFAPKNRRILMLVTPKMQENAAGLTGVFEDNGFKVETRSIDNQYDLNAIQGKLREFLVAHEKEKVALNATGGTKIMALAAHAIFSLAKQPIFYVTEDNSIILIRGNEKSDIFALKSKLTLKDYFGAYGYAVKEREYVHKQGFSDELIQNQEKYLNALQLLNQSARCGKKRLVSFKVQDLIPVRILLELCKEYELLDFTDDSVAFTDKNSRDYVCGNWLEAHTCAVVNSISESKRQTRAVQGVPIRKNDSPNELDVVFLANNAPYVIECKTALLETEGGGDVLYKIDSITQKMGLRTKRMLVTYKNLDIPHKIRAAELRIRVVEGNELRNLKSHLEKWIAE